MSVAPDIVVIAPVPETVLYPHCLLVTVLVPSVTVSCVPFEFKVIFWVVVGAIEVVDVLTVVDILPDVAGEPVAQLTFDVSTTETASLLASEVVA